MRIRTPEEIRADRIKREKSEIEEIRNLVSIEDFNNEVSYIVEQSEGIMKHLVKATEIKKLLTSEEAFNNPINAIFQYNGYMNAVKNEINNDTDSDVKDIINKYGNVDFENITYGKFQKLYIAKEGIVKWIKTIIHKLKQWISFAYNKLKVMLKKFSMGFDKIEVKAKELISKFNSNNISPNFTDYQSEVFVNWLENTYPIMLYLSSEIGFDRQEIRTPEKLINFLKKNNSLKYPKLTNLEVRNVSDYNSNFKNFFENISIQDSTGAWSRDSVIDDVVKKSGYKLKGKELIKPYTADGKHLYVIDMGAEDGKILKTNFIKIPFSSLGIEKPDKGKGSLLLGNNCPSACTRICTFIKDNVSGVLNSVSELPNRLYKEKESLFKELETFDDNDNSEASKCISSYVQFMNKLYSNYLFGEVYATYDALSGAYEMCNKAYLLLTSKDDAN